jgi:hypothetical protein
MTVPTGAVQTFAMIGIREQLSDAIMNISPTETPFTSMIRKGTAKSRTPEWLKDRLRDPSPTNATVEGDDAEGNAQSHPTRLKNVVQLFDETVIVSDTSRAVDTAGRADELKYHVAKAGKALKRDIEMRMLGNYSSVIGNASTAGQCAGAEAWITSNVSRGVSGGNGGYDSGTGLVTLATDGTPRTYTETLLKGVIKSCWEYGGEPTTIMMTGAKKQVASTFTGIAALQNDVNGQNRVMVYGSADLYKSDFGQHRFVANRFVGAGTGRSATNGLYPGNSALVLTPDSWEIKFLQPFKVVELARTGHAEKRLLKAEATLCCKDEGANGVVADLS